MKSAWKTDGQGWFGSDVPPSGDHFSSSRLLEKHTAHEIHHTCYIRFTHASSLKPCPCVCCAKHNDSYKVPEDMIHFSSISDIRFDEVSPRITLGIKALSDRKST